MMQIERNQKSNIKMQNDNVKIKMKGKADFKREFIYLFFSILTLKARDNFTF